VSTYSRVADRAPSDWEGPEWAAPDAAERIASRPAIQGNQEATRLLRLLGQGLIDAHDYRALRAATREDEQA
jgi:hypothetical protein